MHINALYRYPIKGFSPQPLESAQLVTNGYFPGDRLFALENGPSGFSAAVPVHQPKIKFLMLMRNAALASLKTHYDDASGILTIAWQGKEVARGDLRKDAGRAAIESFLTDFCRDELRGAVRLLEAPGGFRFTDSKSGFVSLINLASVRAIGAKIGRTADPLRFRANIYLDGLVPWEEFALTGKLLRVGDACLEVLKRIDRCAATGVEPGSGQRDMDVVQALRDGWGHIDCGVYARVFRGGMLRLGDAAAIETN
ncbi:MAG: MOSC domain-containing protein [Beijerinckiaceae bacterium]|nr:MOSC domain-containing protein [Beijerinckiaceae bacterium]MCI0735476.1 MOSC domain-containing protein [Beijerinckiaceae bacterium]